MRAGAKSAVVWSAVATWRQRAATLTDPGELTRAYLEARKLSPNDPAFYLEAADVFFAHRLEAQGVRALSNLAALEPGNAALLRTLGYALEARGRHELARAALETVARLRPDEPQSWRDLALVEAALGELAPAAAHLEKVVLGTWDSRFADVELVALDELAEVERRAKTLGLGKLSHIPGRFIGLARARPPRRPFVGFQRFRRRSLGDRSDGREGLLPA